MIASTMSLYIARSFITNVLMIFVFFLLLIMAVDSVELSRSLNAQVEGSFGDVLMISMLRVPAFAQRVLPFAVLFGAALSLIMLNRRLELVVARASGVSVWQFLKPVAVSAALIGVVAVLIYQPLALNAQRISQSLEADIFGRLKGNYANKSDNFWLRAGQKSGDVIVRAAIAQDNGRNLAAVSIYFFTPDGAPTERIDAERAVFEETGEELNIYKLTNATVTVPGKVSEQREKMDIPVNVSALELQLSATQAANVPFWELGDHAERAKRNGRNHLTFLAMRQAHMAQPFLFIAMVLIAACMSLRFARFGLPMKLILGGILAGFVLYVVSEIVMTFGSNGLVSPAAAAWSPTCVAILIGVTILLHQEDG
ncbi:LPS export ABC transporter permease LptG [Pseudahrensia aquimaris]|uniref:LPS export ABC transporter permease LptG n=1 Tax=Pseudahrensia aquimaris TaxID=744461 RepID=A0ABW3FCY4_9HYPH